MKVYPCLTFQRFDSRTSDSELLYCGFCSSLYTFLKIVTARFTQRKNSCREPTISLMRSPRLFTIVSWLKYKCLMSKTCLTLYICRNDYSWISTFEYIVNVWLFQKPIIFQSVSFATDIGKKAKHFEKLTYACINTWFY